MATTPNLLSVRTTGRSIAMQKVLFIRAEWDDVANVWVATSDDVPGLSTEADTLEGLSKKLEGLVPELIRLLREADCRFERPGKGDHEIWYSPLPS